MQTPSQTETDSTWRVVGLCTQPRDLSVLLTPPRCLGCTNSELGTLVLVVQCVHLEQGCFGIRQTTGSQTETDSAWHGIAPCTQVKDLTVALTILRYRGCTNSETTSVAFMLGSWKSCTHGASIRLLQARNWSWTSLKLNSILLGLEHHDHFDTDARMVGEFGVGSKLDATKRDR